MNTFRAQYIYTNIILYLNINNWNTVFSSLYKYIILMHLFALLHIYI